MKVLIACGGTGGHFYPGYALGLELKARGHEVLFVLRRGDPAAPRLEAAGLPFIDLDLAGLPRRPSLKWLTFPLRLAQSVRTARRAARAWRPDAAVGTGGYLTAPVAAAAALSGVPFLLHESNAVLGLANRLCAPAAAALALGLPLEKARAGTTLTGTPIREALWRRGSPEEARRRLGLAPGAATLLVFGGSQGAQALNRTVPEGLKLLAGRRRGDLQVLHLSGTRGEAEAREAYAGLSAFRVDVRPYLEAMADAYAAADLAVCRAGASTLAELAAQRLPAVLIPFPHAAGGHQEANARVLERLGAARLLRQAELTPESFAALLEELLPPGGAGALKAMAAGYAGLSLPAPAESARALADLVERAAKRVS